MKAMKDPTRPAATDGVNAMEAAPLIIDGLGTSASSALTTIPIIVTIITTKIDILTDHKLPRSGMNMCTSLIFHTVLKCKGCEDCEEKVTREEDIYTAQQTRFAKMFWSHVGKHFSNVGWNKVMTTHKRVFKYRPHLRLIETFRLY
ncbi:hypothetical protein SUGI_0015820 [Cryptomeria japonica]|nr:hypothetical protein SUGI_0015820 [Cryptomeria japonica]